MWGNSSWLPPLGKGRGQLRWQSSSKKPLQWSNYEKNPSWGISCKLSNQYPSKLPRSSEIRKISKIVYSRNEHKGTRSLSWMESWNRKRMLHKNWENLKKVWTLVDNNYWYWFIKCGNYTIMLMIGKTMWVCFCSSIIIALTWTSSTILTKSVHSEYLYSQASEKRILPFMVIWDVHRGYFVDSIIRKRRLPFSSLLKLFFKSCCCCC